MNRFAGRVGPVLRELDGDALVRRAVHPGHQPFDDEPGAQVQRPDLGQRAGIEVAAVIVTRGR